MRLLDHLLTLGLRGNAAREALERGKIWLDGVPVGDAGRDVDPARIRHVPDARRLSPGRDPVVLRHDAWFVWVLKPAGMLAVPAPKRRADSVVRFVARSFGEGLAVHRLDEGTSGVMLVARTEAAQTRAKALFEAHAMERRYLAFARGRVEATRVETTLVRDRGDGLRGSGPGGKPAVTELRPVLPLRHATLVEARLQTGRTHQVRIALAELGHPILGDDLYGDGRGAERLALHAARLGFTHPFTGERVDLTVPLADDLDRLRRRLGG